MDLVLVYQFLKRLTTPFDKTDAFKLGIIDAEGNVLKPYKTLETKEEKDAYGYFDRLVFGLRRLLEKLPFGKSRFASFAAALYLIKESADPKEHYTDEELMQGLMENYDYLDRTSMKKLNELFESQNIDELSKETLASYKKKAGEDARKADKKGDFKRGNKRFSGIMRATKKEFEKSNEEVDEGVNHDRYMRAHGKKASGTGTWMFTTKRMGDVDYKNSKEVYTSRSNTKLSDAAKDAMKALGSKEVYVMEQIDEASYKVPSNYAAMMLAKKKREKNKVSQNKIMSKHKFAYEKPKKEEVELDEGKLDKSSPIYKEYEALNKKSVADLRNIIGRSHRVADLKGYDKAGALRQILDDKYGEKKVDAFFGEEVEVNEDAPANVTGTGVVGTGDDPVHWKKMDARKKDVKEFLRRYTEQKMKRESIKKKKDFMKQLGIDV